MCLKRFLPKELCGKMHPPYPYPDLKVLVPLNGSGASPAPQISGHGCGVEGPPSWLQRKLYSCCVLTCGPLSMARRSEAGLPSVHPGGLQGGGLRELPGSLQWQPAW